VVCEEGRLSVGGLFMAFDIFVKCGKLENCVCILCVILMEEG
jgi:hypothetical protein